MSAMPQLDQGELHFEKMSAMPQLDQGELHFFNLF